MSFVSKELRISRGIAAVIAADGELLGVASVVIACGLGGNRVSLLLAVMKCCVSRKTLEGFYPVFAKTK